MSFYFSKDPNDRKKIVKDFDALMSQEEKPSLQYIYEKANLSEDQITTLEKYSDKIGWLIQQNHQFWTLFIQGPCKLQRLADLIKALDNKNVIARDNQKRKKVTELFSKSNEIKTKEINDVVFFGIKSDEHMDTLFEFELLSEYIQQGYKVKLEPQLKSGKKSEFAVRKRQCFLQREKWTHIEAKSLNREIISRNIFGETREENFIQTEDNQREIRKVLKNQIKNAREKFINENEPYIIHINPQYPLDLLGVKSKIYLESMFNSFVDSNLKRIVVHDFGRHIIYTNKNIMTVAKCKAY